MNETHAVATLPNLRIEIRHREEPEEGAEYLSINLRATPDLATAAGLLDPWRLMAAAAAWNTWLAWLRLADPFGVWRAPQAAMLPPKSPE